MTGATDTPPGPRAGVSLRHNALSMATRRRPHSVLGLGAALSGVLAYVFFSLVTHALGPVAAAPVSVLWAYWSFAGAALTFPLQHWIARSVPAHEGERSVREALGAVAGASLVIALAAGGASWLARDLLFDTSGPWFPLLVAGVTLGSAVMGVVRGVLTARRRFAAVGAGLVAENAVRCVAAVVLMLAGVSDPVAFGLCLLAGYAAVLAWPSSFRLARTGTPGDDASPLVFLGGAGGGQVLGQAVLTGGPVVLALAGGSPHEVTALFAGLALFRAPYTLALGLVSQLTGRFTRLVVERREDDLRRLRRGLVVVTVLGSVAAAPVGALAGPPLLRLVFGADVSLSPRLSLVLAVASTVAMANLVATLVVMAQGRTLALVRSWVLAVVPGAAWFAVAGTPALGRTCVAFLVVEVAAFCLLLREEARGAADLAG
jgi:O-antigen/teichoic acid export membrane protein